jgi:sortase A
MMFPTPRHRNWRGALLVILLLAGFQQLGSAGWIKAKAHFAQFLIANAWQEMMASNGAIQKPWPWADTWPVARLEVPRHRVDLFVLAGASGNSLAFGPGHETASASPGQRGVTVIGGHRDTHFEFLKHVKPNTLLSLQLPSGERKAYQVNTVRVVDTDKEPSVNLNSEVNELLLITCYPFDALRAGGPLRYVVTARPVLNMNELQQAAFDL